MNSLQNLPLSAQSEIISLLRQGRKIEAIKVYRIHAGCGLKEAKDAIDQISISPDLEKPTSIKTQSNLAVSPLSVSQTNTLVNIFSGFLLGVLLTSVVFYTYPFNCSEKPSNSTVLSNPPKNKSITKPEPHSSISVSSDDNNEIYDPIIPEGTSIDLNILYQQKLANPDYIHWKNNPGLPQGYQYFKEEAYIKHARALIAQNLMPPADVVPMRIPVFNRLQVNIDGIIQQGEWLEAQRVYLEPTEYETSLYLQADNEWLYLAADVPNDTTKQGFDQLRFYFHVDIDPVIKNERIHVSTYRGTLNAIRQTTVKWQGSPPENNDQRWKKYPINDWRIFRLAKGASKVESHRQFEAKINLKEAGLFIGTAFPAFAEVESDPIYIDGKFNKRVYLGLLGSQEKPAWFIMQ